MNGSLTDRLPDEILLQIFEFACCAARFPPLVHSNLTISHVCWRWRNIAIGASSLWRSFCFNPTRWRDICLARSKAAPLELFGSIVPTLLPFPNTPASFLSTHMQRIQRLAVYFPHHEDPSLSTVIPTSAPLLESITLGSSWGHRVPSDFLSGYLPLLKEVALTCLSLTWSPPPFSSLLLTHLHLAYVTPPNLANLLETLRLLPTLVSLRLDNSLPAPSQPLSHDQTDLPMLQTLCLADSGSACLLFLRHVTFPSTTEMTLSHCSQVDELQACLEGLAEQLASHAPLIRSLYIQGDSTGAFVKASPHQLGGLTSDEWLRHSFPAKFNRPLKSTNDPRGTVSPQIIRDFCHHLSLTNVTACFMVGGYDAHQNWSLTFRSFPNLQYLSISGSLLHALFMCFLKEDGAIDELASPVLPSLTVLSVVDSIRREASEKYERLLELLKDREDLDVPLKTLYLEDERVSESTDRSGDWDFVKTLPFNLRFTEVIGRDQKNHIWFRRLPGFTSNGITP